MIKKNRDEKRDIKIFGIGLTVILAIMGSYRFYRGGFSSALWFYMPCGIIAVISLLSPMAIKPLYRIMTIVGHKIGLINTRLLLMAMYYLLFTPLSIIFKMFRKDLLDRRMEKEKMSYWIPRKQFQVDKSRYEEQF